MKVAKFAVAEFLIAADNHYSIIILDVMLVVGGRGTEPACYIANK